MTNRGFSVTVSRELALNALNECDKGSYAENAIADVLSNRVVSEKDRSLVTEIVYGSIRWKMRLDSTINSFLKNSPKKLKSDIRNILRIALYQLIFLDRIPAHSIVNEAVSQAKGLYGGAFSGMVNAILRSVLANTEMFNAKPGRELNSLAVHYSHPEWLVKRWISEYGMEETLNILEFNNRRAELNVRVNSIKTNISDLISCFEKEGLTYEVLDMSLGALTISKWRAPVKELPGFKEGLFAIQNFASQVIATLIKPKPQHEILDVCGAPGGKSSHIAAIVNNQASITLVDANPKRLEEAGKNFKRLGVECVKIIRGNAEQASFLNSLGAFDGVLVDAPCSNLGVLRHNCEAKYRVSPDELNKMAERQLLILSEAAKTVKKSGLLVYCVCSVSQEETFKVIGKFLASHTDFVIDKIEVHEVPSPKFLTDDGFFFSFPPFIGILTDGFFAARIKKI
ncbi:MAG: 16S rRNA (cytosine(967)-C(5))-methyltransferase RsmB [Desulfomonilaceae bacterium]|jgi:16S rRNA (cytosine967-C5)-methyltransferase